MKKLYTLSLALFYSILLSFTASAQYTGGTYTAIQAGNWHTPSGPGIWQAAEPPQDCNNCLITLNVLGTVNLNTNLNLSGNSAVIIGGSGNTTVLQIGNSNASDFSGSYSIILANDGTNSTVQLANGSSLLNAAGAGTYDGILTSITSGGATAYFKEVGVPPSGFFGGSVSVGKTSFGSTLFGPVSLSAIGTLPIILSDFSTVLDKGAVDLSWQTDLEINSDHFVIQSSTNAGASWNNIATVAAHGNSATVIDYSYTDTKPAVGTTEYRLQMVDRDGKLAYSPVRTERIGLISSVSLYPNPARDYVNVVLSGDASVSADIRLISQSGQLLMEKKVTNAGGTTVPLSVSSYPQGNYLVIVTGSDGTQQVNKVLISK
jgi:trimeric autotransporter adhesin